MEPLEIIGKLEAAFPEEILEIYEHQGQAAAIVRRDDIVNICKWLRDTKDIRMNHMMCLCGVDNRMRKQKNLLRFEVVYHFYSISERHMIRLRAQVPEDDPTIDSITSLWCGADWPERECYDLVGISFNGHPHMERILLPEDWEGHPLRKEYPVKGDKEWKGFTELKEKAQELRQFDFYPDWEGWKKEK